jgi:hypothetical protein
MRRTTCALLPVGVAVHALRWLLNLAFSLFPACLLSSGSGASRRSCMRLRKATMALWNYCWRKAVGARK